MSPLQGIGTCLVPRESGVPCGRQIDEGESIGTITLPAGGAVIGHKDCVSAYHTRKGITPKEQEQDVVKRANQEGPGGPVDMTKSTDATQGSFPLEKSPTPSLSEVKMPEGVVPVSSLPFKEPKDNWAEGHVPTPIVTEEEFAANLPDPAQVSGSALEALIPTHGNVSGENLTEEEREIIRKFRMGILTSPPPAPMKEIVTWTTELWAVLAHHEVEFKAPLVADLIAWKQL